MKVPSWLVTLTVLVTTCLIVAQDPANQPPRQNQEVANLEKQIAEMQKKLADMKASEATAVSTKKDSALSLPEDYVKQFKWRSIGPANMSGRITAISVFESDPNVFWVATASGGLIKTEITKAACAEIVKAGA
ncbi:MAG TPA: hypothetical protein PLX97_15680, partial [Gemmatales bacterium]|nr:hypothetical protein [Gemmatales bacterium]